MMCDFPPDAVGVFVCRRCGATVRSKTAKRVVRRCDAPEGGQVAAPNLVFNDLSAGPCVHRGELVAIEGCQLCGQRGKPVETFRCLHPDVATVVSEARWRVEQPRKLTCGGCGLYAADRG